MSRMKTLPLVVDIKRHSLEDGPGIRSVVFFKGCLLTCIFCHNPEMQDPDVEIVFSPRKCIRCGNCADACPEGAIDLDFPGRIHREKCVRCGQCANVCPGNALKLLGTYYPAGDLTEILLRDLPFYRHSGGGVTLSGGECTLYLDYLEVLLKFLKAKEIHVVLETSGYFDYNTFKQKILPYIDLIYYDIKFAETGAHLKYTGKPNHRIRKNFRRLTGQKSIAVHPRIPLIPGITATRANLTSIVDFLWEAGADNVSLLPYNPMGIDTAVSLGRPKPSISSKFMKLDEQKELSAMFRAILAEKQRTRSMASRSFSLV